MRIGIDVGGTKIEGIVLDSRGHSVAQRRIAAPRGSYDATVAAIVNLVGELEHEAGGQARVGLGIPGIISPATGLVKNANSTWLNGRPLDQDLSRALGRPVRLANDANCFALSEATDGAAAGAPVVFGVIIGTGTGGGIVINGAVLMGANAIAGEWGHNPLPWTQDEEWPGVECYCGRTGCIETFLSGPGLQRDYMASGGEQRPAHEIASRAAAGETRATAVLDRYVHRMARALATIINVVDPDVIVLGGGLSNMSLLYSAVPQHWIAYVFSDRVATRLLPAKHGDSSGVRGAAWLWGSRE